MPAFIPGLRLSELFYAEAVRPILAHGFPDLPYSAALLGSGSEVIGFDTARSTDHHWGPRLLLFLAEDDFARHADPISASLRHELPYEFRGYSTNFRPSQALGDDGVMLLAPTTTGPVEHMVHLTTLPRFLHQEIGLALDASVHELAPIDWLLCTEQRLLAVTAGAVFHDGLGELEPARAALRYYPDDVWRYLLAAQWARIGQQEPFVGRCGEAGDDIGSALIAAALARDVMRLGFLIERTYAPYSKWFGTAFARLRCAPHVLPHLTGATAAGSWPERERHLSAAYAIVARLHNDLGITDPLPTDVSPFHNRPFLVIHGERFAEAIRARITDERVRRLPPDVGSVDQFVDSTDLLTNNPFRARLRAVYTANT